MSDPNLHYLNRIEAQAAYARLCLMQDAMNTASTLRRQVEAFTASTDARERADLLTAADKALLRLEVIASGLRNRVHGHLVSEANRQGIDLDLYVRTWLDSREGEGLPRLTEVGEPSIPMRLVVPDERGDVLGREEDAAYERHVQALRDTVARRPAEWRADPSDPGPIETGPR